LVIFLSHAFVSDEPPRMKTDLFETKFDVSFFAMLPIIFSSYGFQAAFFTAFSSLKKKSNKNGILTDLSGRMSLYLIFILTVVISSALYGEEVQKNLLKTMSKEDGVFPAILESLFLVVPTLAIPVIFFMGKEGILIIFDELTRKSYSKQNMTVKDQESPSGDIEKNSIGKVSSNKKGTIKCYK